MGAGTIIGWALLALTAAGIGYGVHALVAIRRFGRRAPPPPAPAEPVTLLKPLHGAEPRLAANLATFLAQDWPASVQMVAGVQDPADPALAVALALPQGPWRTVSPVIDATPHGANAKVANLVNMAPAAAHDLLVLSDSDMSVAPDYLARVAAALAAPGVGAVTCVYRGRGDAGRWSALCAASVSYGFLPAVLVGLSLGLAQPCMGSTVALRRGTLARIGGFRAFADRLADDYAIGEAVRGLGLTVAVPPLVLTHGFAERSLGEVWRHELRWAATTRAIVPASYAGTVVMHPVPFALLALPFAPWPAAALLALGVAVRLLVKQAVDRRCGASTLPGWALPARDLLSFAVFLASFFVAHVDWRGARLKMGRDGLITADPEPSP